MVSAPRQVSAVRRGSEPPTVGAPVVAEIVRGDAILGLGGMPASSVHCCVTSPPYFGLRNYDVAPQVWGGVPGCRHRWRGEGLCRRCGAWRGCLGLEPDVDLYVRHLLAVMREVRRVLREDGSLWLVLGDCFATGRGGRGSGTKPKDLLGVPWRVALALQEDGWWLRSDIIWQKPDAMPEPVSDRPTRAHEFVFLLTKSRRYFYDAEAVREPDKGRRSGNGYVRPARLSYGGRGQEREWIGGAGRNRRSVWTISNARSRGAHRGTFPEALVEPCVLAGSSPAACSICGAPWRRRVVSGQLPDPDRRRVEAERQTVAWEASCGHDDPGARCRVLDPFAGIGTTGAVAARHGRDFSGFELSEEYAGLALKRVRDACSEAVLPGAAIRLRGEDGANG